MVVTAGGEELRIRSKTLGEPPGVPKFTEKGVVPPGQIPPAAGIDLSIVLESLARINDTLQLMLQSQRVPEENYFDTGLVAVTASTPTKPANPEIISAAGSPGYDRIQVYEALTPGRNSPNLSVINDGTSNLFILQSSDGENWTSVEVPILVGESRVFHNVYELRIRSPVAGNLTTFAGGVYRATEYDYWLPYIKLVASGSPGGFNPIDKSSVTNQAQPAANTNILGTDLTPTVTPTTFRITVAMSNGGNFSASITNGVNPAQVVLFNAVPGPALIAGGLYTFDLPVHAGDSVNFQYSSTGGTIQILRVQEIDAAAA